MKEDLKFKNQGDLGRVMSYELRFYAVVGTANCKVSFDNR